MKFFYNLRRYEDSEYVVVILEEDGLKGVGAVIPERKRGENYKTVMGAIEEYRHIVEKARPEHFASISFRLREEFPGHPKVTFAISAAALELFSNITERSVEDILMVEDEGAPHLENWRGEVIVPEEVGGVFEVLSVASKDVALFVRKYPHGEMRRVLMALARRFAGYVT